MEFTISKEKVLNTALFSISVLLLILPAIFNGYPLFFSDSGTYLVSGQIGEVPIDRPIIYGLFVRHMSLSWSIWLVIIFQSIFFNYLLFLIAKFLIKARRAFLLQFVFALFLAVFTGIGYYCSLVIADIFTPIAILCLFFLIYLSKEHYLHLSVLSIMLFLALLTHLSHIPITLGIVFFIFLYLFIFDRKEFKIKFPRILYISSLFAAGLLTIALVNYSYGVGFKISRTNNIILATRFIDSGLAQKFLIKNCEKGNFNPPYAELCDYRFNLDKWPSAGAYLYDEKSPLYTGDCVDNGWINCWLEKNEAYGALIEDILSDPELRTDFFALVITGTLKQLVLFEQSRLDPLDFESIIEEYYEDDLFLYRNATQTSKTLNFEQSSLVEAIVVDISVLTLLYFILFYWKRSSSSTKLFVLLVIISLLVNAVFCSTLSNVIPRYQGRIVFLLPLAILVILSKYLKKKNYSLHLSEYL